MTTGQKPRSRKKPTHPRTIAILAYAKDHPTATLSEIGRAFEVTRENVRQVLKAHANQTGLDRRKLRMAQRVTLTNVYFKRCARAWLSEIGYGYCSRHSHAGGRCVTIDSMQTKYACKACEAKSVSDYYHRDGTHGYYANRPKYADAIPLGAVFGKVGKKRKT